MAKMFVSVKEIFSREMIAGEERFLIRRLCKAFETLKAAQIDAGRSWAGETGGVVASVQKRETPLSDSVLYEEAFINFETYQELMKEAKAV